MVTKIKKINNYQPKIIVILFGLMHSGKSTAIRFFRQCGFKSYCCDDFARRVVMTNQDQIKTILHHQALRTAIFTSGKTRKIINNLV